MTAGDVKEIEPCQVWGPVEERKDSRDTLKFLTYVTKQTMASFSKVENTRERVGFGSDIISLV